MIRNNSSKLYVGVSKNPEDRLRYHNTKRGAVFTLDGKFSIVFLEPYSKLSEARSREIQIKKWSRKKKDFLISLYNTRSS